MEGRPSDPVRQDADDGRAHLFLRYWRAILKHEALSQLGCPAEPLDEPDGPFRPEVGRPSASGRSYFEIPTDGEQAGDLADLLVRNTGDLLLRPLTHAHRPLFERWLRARYRAQGRGGLPSAHESAGTLAVGFPVVRYRQRGRWHLSALLQLPVVPTWCEPGGDLWQVPSPQEAKGTHILSPPASLRLTAFDTAALGQPFLLNEHLMYRVLGHDPESVADLLGWLEACDDLTPEQMLQGLTSYLYGSLDGDLLDSEADPAITLGTLAGAMAQALPKGSRAGVEGAAIVCETDWGVPTAQLQREMGEVLRRNERHLPEPLIRYLLGDLESPSRAPRYGSLGRAELTAAQRCAAERSLSSPLVVVEGPPGTGKTEVILSLAADALIRSVDRGVYDERKTPAAPLMVTSTNNQAVDAVLTPLMGQSTIPIAIRMGNRHVLSTRTETTLADVLEWLQEADPLKARVQLSDALERFRAIKESLDGVLTARSEADHVSETRAFVEAALPGVDAALADLEPAGTSCGAIEGELRLYREALHHGGELYDALDALYERMESHAPFHPTTADGIWSREVLPHLTACLEPLAKVSGDHLSPEGIQPPGESGGDSRGSWLDRVYHQQGLAAALVDDLRAQLERLLQDLEAQTQREALLSRRAALEKSLENTSAEAEEHGSTSEAHLLNGQRALLKEALNVRDAWARARANRLIPLLRRWRTAAQGRAWWQGHLEDEAERSLFAALFPVAGCTLLSIGTSWPLIPGIFDQLVVDESGQCLPSYPVTALYRSRRALFLGDTNQLEPVNGLSPNEEAAILGELYPSSPPAWLDGARCHRDEPNSAQALAERSSAQVVHLRDHFRCQPDIIAISNRLCGYDLNVRTSPASLSDTSPALTASVQFVPNHAFQERWCGSQRNPEEARMAAELVAKIIDDGVSPESIGLISPYRAQSALLESQLRSRGVPLEDWETSMMGGDRQSGRRSPGVLLGTIHRIQGGERDVVVFSTVATEARSLGWLNRRPNLLNVAVSRARKHLVILGCPDALQAGEYTRHLVPPG